MNVSDERKPPGLARFLTGNPVIMVSLIGASAFFVSRLAQTSFYGEFGLEPQDVGLSYTETLSRAAAGLIVALLVFVAITLVWWLYLRYVAARPRNAREQRRLVRGAAFVFASMLLILVYALPSGYVQLAEDVKDGNALRGITWRFLENPLGLRVERVHVSWIDDMEPAYDFGSDEVMYLGRASGVAAFFDPRTQRTVRVPDSAIVIEWES